MKLINLTLFLTELCPYLSLQGDQNAFDGKKLFECQLKAWQVNKDDNITIDDFQLFF